MPILGWGIVLAIPAIIPLATIVSAVLIPILVKRIRSIYRLFHDGTAVTGRIKDVGFEPWGAGGHIKYQYKYKGRTYEG